MANTFSETNTEGRETKKTEKVKFDKYEQECQLFRKQQRVFKWSQQVEEDPSGKHQTMFTETKDLISSNGSLKRLVCNKHKKHADCSKQANNIKCVLNVLAINSIC